LLHAGKRLDSKDTSSLRGLLLRERIPREHQAAEWAVTGLAEGNLKHCFITRRMEQMGVHQEQFAALIGEAASIAMVCSILDAPTPQLQTGE
jgi:hypothetical protein